MASHVSVIVPAYNAEHSIHKALSSVRDQGQSEWEMIVIDDGSTDGTCNVVRECFPEANLIQQSNSGQGAARNRGFQAASGEFIALLDSDDYWKPSFLSKTVSFLREAPEAIAVSTGFLAKTTRGMYVGPSNIEKIHSSNPRGIVLDEFFDFWGKYDHIRTGTVLLRREAIAKSGGQLADLRISQDLEFWGYVATFGKWGFIPEILWVGDSASAAIEVGWKKRYAVRRRNCPNVETWERRVRPKLAEHQLTGFRKVRGRVAASFAQNKLLGGESEEALKIIKKYGHSMPDNRLTRVLRWGAKGGGFRWRLAIQMISAKDSLKGHGIG